MLVQVRTIVRRYVVRESSSSSSSVNKSPPDQKNGIFSSRAGVSQFDLISMLHNRIEFTTSKKIYPNMKSASVILFLLSEIAAVSAHQVDNEITTDSSCYHFRQNMNIKFTTEEPTKQNWVGVYHATDDLVHSSYTKPIQWLWSCGPQAEGCEKPNEATFDLLSKPLEPGVYKLQSHGIGYHGHTASAVSDNFSIKEKGETCFNELVHKSNVRSAASVTRLQNLP